MKDFDLYVFSGTGNTLRCAAFLREELEALGAFANLRRIEGECAPAAAENMIICYPVHGFNAPANVVRFCKKVPEGAGTVYFLKTSGEPSRLNDHSSAQLRRILRKKGYGTGGEFHCIMPYNMVFRHSDAMAAKMWATAQERIPAMAQAIFDGAHIPVRAPLSARFMSALCRIEHGFYPLNGRLYRVRADRCTRCMQCVKACPMQNIHFEGGRFRFGNACICCTRCSFSCPQDAIRIGLLDFMRVNGKYDFSQDPKDAAVGRFCRKSYERYFRGEP